MTPRSFRPIICPRCGAEADPAESLVELWLAHCITCGCTFTTEREHLLHDRHAEGA